MTSRKREAPVVTMHVRSANVLRENTESRRSLDSSEKNRSRGFRGSVRGPSSDSAGTRDPVPVAAGRRRRMQPASHDEDTGVVLSVLVCQGWHPNHHHGRALTSSTSAPQDPVSRAARQPSNFTAK